MKIFLLSCDDGLCVGSHIENGQTQARYIFSTNQKRTDKAKEFFNLGFMLAREDESGAFSFIESLDTL